LNIFKKMALKALKLNNQIVTKILQSYGGIVKHTEVNYHNMSKEGYTNFAVFACLDKIVKAAIAINWEVATYDKNGKTQVIPNHPLKLLMENPNPLQGQSKFLERAIKFYYIGGETFFHKIVVGGKPKELYCYRPDRCNIEFGTSADNPIKSFEYQAGYITKIDPSEILHWKTFNPLDQYDGLGRGISLLSPAARVIDQNNAIKQWNYSLMKNGAKKDGAFVTKEVLTQEAYERGKDEIAAEYEGVNNVGGYMLLEGGADFREFSITPKDTDWLEGSKQSVVEICSALGVDPILIGYNEFSSYNNKLEAKKALYTETVIPLMKELADELAKFLELKNNEFFYFDYSDIQVLQENMKEKFDMVSDKTFMTENEKREYVGLGAEKGLDVYRIPMSYIDIPKGTEIPSQEGSEVNFKSLLGGSEVKSIKRTRVFKVFNDATDKGRDKYTKIIGKYFLEQSKRVLKDIDIKMYDSFETKEALLDEETAKLEATKIVDKSTNWITEATLLTAIVNKLYLENTEVGYNISNTIFGLNLDLEAIMKPELIKWAQNNAATQVKYVTETTKDQLRRTITNGLLDGLSNKEIAENIATIMNSNSVGRARTIADTEVHNSIMKGNHQAKKDAGVKKKKWLTARDEVVRGLNPKDKANHVILDGQIRDIDKPFSNGLMHPGDPTGSPSEIINCRCITIPADFDI